MPPPSTGSKGVSLAVEAMSWWRFITRQRLAPYHPMPTAVVHQSLKLANIGSSDHVVDLGCGDGRILITACRDYGARTGCGYELVPAIVSEAKHQVQQAKLDNQITIHQRDALSASLCDATVITCYLSAGGNALLAPRLMAHLHHHHHARAVSFLFDFDGIMTPAQTVLGDGGIPIHLYNHTSIPPHTMQQIQRQRTHEQSQTQSAAFTPTNTPTPTPSTSTETSSSSPARVSLASSIFARLRSPFGS